MRINFKIQQLVIRSTLNIYDEERYPEVITQDPPWGIMR